MAIVRAAALIAALLSLTTAAALAADEEPNIEFFYPIVIRRPVIERELELRVGLEKGRDGRATEVSGAVEIPILPRWQVELEVPLVFRNPREGAVTGGVADVALENKFLLWKSVDHLALVAGGFEMKFPTGSERRGLGGELAIEPFLAAGVGVGKFDVLAELAYEWNLNAAVEGPREQVLTAGMAVGYTGYRHVTPLLELVTVTPIRGAEEDRLRGRTQLYLTPGVNVHPWPATTLRFGVEVPLTHAHTFDYALRGALVWEF